MFWKKEILYNDFENKESEDIIIISSKWKRYDRNESKRNECNKKDNLVFVVGSCSRWDHSKRLNNDVDKFKKLKEIKWNEWSEDRGQKIGNRSIWKYTIKKRRMKKENKEK